MQLNAYVFTPKVFIAVESIHEHHHNDSMVARYLWYLPMEAEKRLCGGGKR
jgi:hypothetical protein